MTEMDYSGCAWWVMGEMSAIMKGRDYVIIV